MADPLYLSLHYLLQHFGHDVLLQRRLVYDDKSLYGSPDDGTQFAKGLEKWTCYSTFAGRKSSIAKVQQERPESLIRTVDLVFYFEAPAKPFDGDRIYQPDDRFEYMTFLINYSHPVRGVGGKVLYYEVGAQRELPG